MTTTIIIWGALTMMVLTAAYALTLAVEIRRLRKELGEALSECSKAGGRIGALERKVSYAKCQRDGYAAEVARLNVKNTLLKQRLAKFETYKSLPRDENGRFMKNGADPQISKP